MRIHRPLLVGMLLVLPLLLVAAEASQACMAISLPDVRIMRAPTAQAAGGRLHYVALASEYSCAAMPPKTYCAIGLCLKPSATVKKANLQVHAMKFVAQDTGEAVIGFEPKANALTSKSFKTRKDGIWYGFSALFKRRFDREGGIEVRIDFSTAPGVSEEELKQIFSQAFIGAAGGNKDGMVVNGHHQEIVAIGKVKFVGEAAKEERPAARP